MKPGKIPDGSNPLAEHLIDGLKLRALSAEVLDYVGAFDKAKECIEDAAPHCEADLLEIKDWNEAKLNKSRPRLLQEIWLLLQAGLCCYRSGNYDGARRAFLLCDDVIDRVAPKDGSNPRWGTRARISYSLGLVCREQNELDEALELFTKSTEYAYNSLKYPKKSSRQTGAEKVSWLTSIAIARSLGMGMASVHHLMGRTDLAKPLLLAAKAMLPENEFYISTHLDMLRLSMQSLDTNIPDEIDEIIDGLNMCHKQFSTTEHEHALYRARAAHFLIQAYLHRSALVDGEAVEKYFDQCKKLLMDLEAKRSGDSRYHLHRYAVESWMLRKTSLPEKLKEAEAVASSGLKQSSKAFNPHVYMDLCLARGKAREKLNNLKGAEEDFKNALEAAREANNSRLRAAFLLHLCRVSWLLQDAPTAVRYRRDYINLKNVTKVCTGDVARLESDIEDLFKSQSSVFTVSMHDNLKDPKKKIGELRAFLVRWAKQPDATDAEAARRLNIERSTLNKWRNGLGGSED